MESREWFCSSSNERHSSMYNLQYPSISLAILVIMTLHWASEICGSFHRAFQIQRVMEATLSSNLELLHLRVFPIQC